jgi:hypothetical protein
MRGAVSSFHDKKMQTAMMNFVDKYLIAKDAKCYRHCQGPTTFVPLVSSESSLTGAYVCPQSYVSRVVYFADEPSASWLERFLTDQLGSVRVRSKDIRKATRHGWELGEDAEEKIRGVSGNGKLVQHYWTFYARSEEEKQTGTYLCSKENGGCGRLYLKSNSDNSKLCPNCRSS